MTEKRIQISLPKSLYDNLNSQKTKELIYTQYTGNDINSQKRVDQVYSAIEYELYLISSMFWKKQVDSKYNWLSFSKDFLHSVFNNRYIAVKDTLKEVIDMEVFSTGYAQESYQATKTGYCKKYRSKINLSYRLEDTIKVKVPLNKSRRLRRIFGSSEHKEFMEMVDIAQSLLEIDPNTPSEYKEEFYHLPPNLYKKKTDNRFYGKGSCSTKGLREHLRYKGQKLVEVDIPSAFVHFSIHNCYTEENENNLDNLEEYFEKDKLLNSIKRKNFYNQIADGCNMERGDVKDTFNTLLNNSIYTPDYLSGSLKTVWEWIYDRYPIFAKYILELNTEKYAKSHLSELHYKLFKKSSRIAYLINTEHEVNLMMNIIKQINNKHGEIGFLWVHDGIYVPESIQNSVESIMKDEFKSIYGYNLN